MGISYTPPSTAKPLDLRGAFLKIKWAKKHIADLGKERVAFLGSNPYYGIPQFNAETNRTRFILESVPDIPPEIRLLLGDVVHNLRTALDHLACELVRSTGIAEPKVYFPICETEQIYKAESGGKTIGMPEGAKEIIDRLCPYGGGNHLLWGLHRLDIIDKHRLLSTTTLKTSSWSVTLDKTARDYTFAFLFALKAGDVIGDLEGNHESDKQMSVTPDIAFCEPGIFEGDAIFPTLTILAQYVWEIVGMFGDDPL
jgi:hypothetical protein